MAPKNPPPFVPICLIAIKAAAGPRETCTESPCKVVIVSFPSNVIGVPLNNRATATIAESGNKIRVQLLMK
ncbi:hypothetical protein D3C85_1070050 [compost metagenome]